MPYEDGGVGELVHQQNGAAITLPIVLTALPDSTAVDSVYVTASGVTPRIRAEVINPFGTRKLQPADRCRPHQQSQELLG